MRKLILCAVLACSCNPINNPTPTRSLDRPSDVALVCAVRALNGDAVLAPLSVCDYSTSTTYSLNTPSTTPDKFLTLTDNSAAKGQLFALVSNTTRGEVALVANGTQEFFRDPRNPSNNDPNIQLVRQVVQLDRDTQVSENLPASIIDLDNASPGYGFIPVGANPERIRATDDGCVAMTANVDSCDLAVIDMQALLRKLNGQALGASTVLAAVRRLQPRARDVGSVRGPLLRARPAWIEFTPDTTGRGTTRNNDGKYIGNQCTAATGYRAFVAFPGCRLVGEVDLGTGELVDALQLTATGAVRVAPEDVRCPAECTISTTADGGTGPAPDLATDDGGGTTTDGGAAGADMGDGLPPLFPPDGIYPRTFALDAQRMYIGDATRDVITTVDLDTNGRLDPSTVRQIPLEAPGGITVVRLSPLIKDPFDPADQGTKFLYAVARDRTVRVIDVGLGYECETNPDGRILNQTYQMFDTSGTAPVFRTETEPGPNQGRPRWPNLIQQTLRCLRIGQIPRSPLARSPGILLPGASVPRDVTFTRGTRPADATGDQTAPSANPRLTVGDYAWIIGSSGGMVTVSLFDACPQPNVPQGATSKQSCVYPVSATPDIYLSSVTTARTNAGQPTPEPIELAPHRIRNLNGRFERSNDLTNPNDGAPRLAQAQLTIGGSPFDIYQTTVPFLCDFGETSSGQQQNFNRCINNTTDPQDGTVRFYDSSAVRNENWGAEWESILLNPRPSGVLSRTGASSMLTDTGAGFCSRAVRAGDKVDLLGCSSDTDCRSWQACYRDPAAPLQNPGGLCLSRDPATRTRAQEVCRPWTRGVRRYRISEARSDRLELEEIAEPESPRDTHTCTVLGDTAECADVRVLVRSNSATVSLPTTCLPDGAGVLRCLRGCRLNASDTNNLCGPGFICAAARSGFEQCLRAPLPPAQDTLCFTEAQDYQVRVGDAFLVTGEISQALEEGQVDPATGLCTTSTNPQQRFLQSRIPLDERVMECPPDVQADWLAPLPNLPAGSYLPYSNVCRLVTPPSCDDNGDCGTGGVCLLESRTCLGNTIVRFSNPVFEAVVVVPPRALLASANGPGVPLTYSRVPAIDAQVNFRFTGGYGPLSFVPQSTVGRTPQLARVIIAGPDRQTLYIIDEGRENVTTGVRGQLLRFYANTKNPDTGFNVQ